MRPVPASGSARAGRHTPRSPACVVIWRWRPPIRLCAILALQAGAAATPFPGSDPFWNSATGLHQAAWGFAGAIAVLPPATLLGLGQLIGSLRPAIWPAACCGSERGPDSAAAERLRGQLSGCAASLICSCGCYSRNRLDRTAALYGATVLAHGPRRPRVCAPRGLDAGPEPAPWSRGFTAAGRQFCGSVTASAGAAEQFPLKHPGPGPGGRPFHTGLRDLICTATPAALPACLGEALPRVPRRLQGQRSQRPPCSLSPRSPAAPFRRLSRPPPSWTSQSRAHLLCPSAGRGWAARAAGSHRMPVCHTGPAPGRW